MTQIGVIPFSFFLEIWHKGLAHLIHFIVHLILKFFRCFQSLQKVGQTWLAWQNDIIRDMILCLCSDLDFVRYAFVHASYTFIIFTDNNTIPSSLFIKFVMERTLETNFSFLFCEIRLLRFVDEELSEMLLQHVTSILLWKYFYPFLFLMLTR